MPACLFVAVQLFAIFRRLLAFIWLAGDRYTPDSNNTKLIKPSNWLQFSPRCQNGRHCFDQMKITFDTCQNFRVRFSHRFPINIPPTVIGLKQIYILAGRILKCFMYIYINLVCNIDGGASAHKTVSLSIIINSPSVIS